MLKSSTSPQIEILQGLRTAGRAVRRPDCTLTTVDHNVPTSDRSAFDTVENFIKETDSRLQVLALEVGLAHTACHVACTRFEPSFLELNAVI